ncbi:hypothetical protein BWI93_24825 [Siphonobacter sp. BAB-5385]|uniref:hypothetical protein n=1 Tax=Siphonobacter sp. BAB-5385 TaxID=1864822 RepID=UPI000B9EBBFE|nr:hypothetical protein [Siphonobacter sp. BAB-5385]OZI05659.1 hypothetical protein BWI93_24825 [Siphonobacter sp. BAB-5385]
MELDITQLMKDISTAVSAVLGKDVTTIRGFRDRQLKAIAQQSALITAGIATGEITEETREFFLDSLQDMVLNFLKTLQGVAQVTIEKAWNAAVTVIWDAIEKVTGIRLVG